jgi:3-(3-hydroxy-phenyl)propionate hydroxylase
VIAGAGPVGLSLALGLVRAGVPCAVYERGTELADEARASTFHSPTLEMFAAWGVLPPILARGRIIRHLQFWERERRALVADFDYALIARDTPYPFRLQCPQNVVTRILAPAIEATGIGRVYLGHEARQASTDGDYATLVVHGPEGEAKITADYVVGADGSGSLVRESLGMQLFGLTYEDRFLLVATDLDIAGIFPGMSEVAYIFDPEEWVIVMHLPEVVRVVFRLSPEADLAEAESEPSIRARMERFLGRRVDFRLHGRSIYRVHQRTADSFRKGRVLLAGDAAHINNPAGGMGMNSGIHDAYHLAEALAAVVHGGPESLLDAYDLERRGLARDLVQKQTDKNYKDLAARELADIERRNSELREAAADPEAARRYLLRTAMLDQPIRRPTLAAPGASASEGLAVISEGAR